MKNKIIMVYPLHGFSGAFVKHAPLSILYAVSGVVKQGIKVDILDARLFPDSWKDELQKRLTSDVLAVGISVMSGKPIQSAVDIGRFVKTIDAQIPVVWGGPHATFYPQTILEQEPNCDYVVNGYGSRPFELLVTALVENKEPSGIAGVSYRKKGAVIFTPAENKFEFIHHRDIPYDLIKDYRVYGQLDQNRNIFSLYSLMGCAYNCAFCSSPAQYRNFPKRWVPLPIAEVVDHIEYVVNQFQANYIYFIDDDSFIDLRHVESIIDEINRRGIKVGLGFRGARVNEIKKMSDEFIEKLIAAGTDILHIGAESGSDRILAMVRKNCTVQDIIKINQKLARHPKLLAAYNFIIGLPTETLEEVKATRDLMFRLVADNPHCLIFQPNKFRPLPGTDLFDVARSQYSYEPPKTLEEWSNIEAEGNFCAPWYSGKFKKFLDLMLIGSYFIDNKIKKVTTGKAFKYRLMRLASDIYGPIARFRLRHGIYQFLIEYSVYKLITRLMSKMPQVSDDKAP